MDWLSFALGAVSVLAVLGLTLFGLAFSVAWKKIKEASNKV